MPGHVTEAFVQQVRHIGVDNPDRPLDVVHYWQSSEQIETSLYYTQLRQRVTRQLNHTQMHLATTSSSLSSSSAKFVDRVGIANEDTDLWIELDVSSSGDLEAEEQQQQQEGYVENDSKELTVTTLHIALLASTKIVVVTQNDEWEDNDNRLMEALASGALVLADRMLAPPAGLKDRTNIVWFDTPDELDRLVQYYLREDEKRETVARHGVQWALGRHRPWHVLEWLLIGKAWTRADKGYDVAAPPKRERAATTPTTSVHT